jgi:hypothetical protein
MLSASLMVIARNRIALELQDRQDAHRSAFGDLKAKYSAKGTLASSFAQAALDQAIGAEYRIRAMMIWQVLGRALSGDQFSGSLQVGAQLKSIVEEFLRTGCGDLERDHAFLHGLVRESPHMRSIDFWRESAYERAASEIDLTLVNVGRVEARGGTVVNIYQPSGIVQTGIGSTATWTQNLGASERDTVRRALKAAEQALQGSVGDSNEEMRPVLEVIQDAKAEMDRNQPNVPRLQGAFMTIATTVQALGSAAPAYQLLRGAAALFGVTLP